MKDNILEVLKSEETAFEFEKIINLLDIHDDESFRNVIASLNDLENEGLVYRTKREKFMYFPYCHLKQGKLDVNKKGFGFVITGDKDIYIDEKNMNGAVNGDIVNVELLTDEFNPKPEGKIVKIVKRELNNLVGEVIIKNNKGYVILDDEN